MADPRWMPVEHEDRYHGQVDTTDRRSFWVVPRLHLAGGWYLEVRVDEPDGELLDRRRLADTRSASTATTERRQQIARLDQASAFALPWVVEEPATDLGVVVLHGQARDRRRGDRATFDGDDVQQVCRVMWTPAGPHWVSWATVWEEVRHQPYTRQHQDLVVQAGTVTHTHPHWLGPFARNRTPTVPPWHRCPSRSLRFEDGTVHADIDIRRAAKS